MGEERAVKMKSVMSTCIRMILVVAIATGVMASPIWGQEIETAVTSFVIGGVTLQEDVKNPPVPSGMQRFEITMNKPVVTLNELREPETLPYFDGDSIAIATITKYFDIDRDFISYPPDLIVEVLTAPDLSASVDGFTLTGTINLPDSMSYQVLIGESDPDPIDEQQQYFFGTSELPDAVISGVGTLPDGFTVNTRSHPGGVAIIDPERFVTAFPYYQEWDDLIILSMVRIADFNEQQIFEIKQVPDGTYAMMMGADLFDAMGNRFRSLTPRGINLTTGEVDSTEFVHVIGGKSVTDLQMMLQIVPRDPEPQISEILEVKVQKLNAETKSFVIQPINQQIQIDASEALTVSPGQISAEDILKIFLFHNPDDFARIIFPITDLMVGDTVSLLGTYTSETMFQAFIVIRHESPLARNGDIDGDGDVDFSDFLLFTSAFGTIEGGIGYNPAADLDGDGAVVFSDFLIFASAFGKSVG
ncbi:MAG: hypothetical protein F4Z86_03010 [Gemmatimonadetes bacterium]|nr:hypothetical protein [Gemmatimonadota bacterium]MYB58272.1 hypothetical protein [Gemmatimonadota bacterium]